MRQSQWFNTTAQWSITSVTARYITQELDRELDIVLLDCLQCRLIVAEWSFHFNGKKYSKTYLKINQLWALLLLAEMK